MEAIPIGRKLLDYKDRLSHDQKKAIIRTLTDLRDISNEMLKILGAEDKELKKLDKDGCHDK